MAIKAVWFGTWDKGDRLEHLVPYRPSPETLVASIKALGLRLSRLSDRSGALTGRPPERRTQR